MSAYNKRAFSAVVAVMHKPFFKTFQDANTRAKYEMSRLLEHMENEVRLHVTRDISTVDRAVYGVSKRVCFVRYNINKVEEFLRNKFDPTHVVVHPVCENSRLSKHVTTFLLLFTTLRSTATDLYVDSQSLKYINRRPGMTVLPKCCMTFIHTAARVRMKPSSNESSDASSYYHFDLASIRELRPNIVTGIYQLSIVTLF